MTSEDVANLDPFRLPVCCQFHRFQLLDFDNALRSMIRCEMGIAQDREVEWFEQLERGDGYPREWPLCPAVACESPAKWYLEHGSGRATCFFRRLLRSSDHTSRAFGHLGVRPDPDSTFMREQFSTLLSNQ